MGVNSSTRTAGGRPDHALTLGADARDQAYLYDPWPRWGDQLLYWPSREINDYFTGRTWVVRALIEAASGQASASTSRS